MIAFVFFKRESAVMLNLCAISKKMGIFISSTSEKRGGPVQNSFSGHVMYTYIPCR